MRKNDGQILIEVIVALSVVVVAFSGALSLLGTSVGLTRTISNQYIGTYLAAEGVEIVKNIIDENYFSGGGSPSGSRAWNQGIHVTGDYYPDFTTTADTAHASMLRDPDDPLKYDDSDMRYSYGAGIDTKIWREVHIQNESDAIVVRSTVRWEGKGGTFEAEVSDRFTYWWRSD